MNSKTALTVVIGTIAGLGLVMGTVAFAQNNGHMGNTQNTDMMGQTIQQNNANLDTHHGKTVQQNTRGRLHGKTVQQDTYGGMHTQPAHNQRPAPTHHADNSQTTGNYPCHDDTSIKSEAKT